MQIYISKNNETRGPFDEAQARDLLKQGDFDPNDLACCEGDEKWVPISELLIQRVKKPTGVTPQNPQENKPSRGRPLIVQFVVVFFAIVLAGLTLMVCQKYITQRTLKLDGEVFVVTKGGQSIKLGLVEVGVFPLEAVARSMADKKAAEQAIAARLDSLFETAKADEKKKDEVFKATRYEQSSGAYTKAYNDYYSATYLTEELEEKR